MTFTPWAPTIGNLSPPLTVANGGTGATTAAAALTALGGLVRQAATPVAGTAKINGTQTILTWTSPNDGNLHRAMLFVMEIVTVAETGGAVVFQMTTTNGTAAYTVFNAGAGTGATVSGTANFPFAVQPNQTVSLQQSTALTAGTSSVIAEIWGS